MEKKMKLKLKMNVGTQLAVADTADLLMLRMRLVAALALHFRELSSDEV